MILICNVFGPFILFGSSCSFCTKTLIFFCILSFLFHTQILLHIFSMEEPKFFRTFEKFESTEIHDTEEAHRIIQARLACWLEKRSGRRLLGEGQSSTTHSSHKKVCGM